MLFNTFEFLVFFVFVYAIYRIVPHKPQNILLLLASYFFYGCWDWRFLSLILLSTCVDFYCGNRIHSSSDDRTRKVFLAVSMIVNLGVLGFFKYFNFFIESLDVLFSGFGWSFNYSLMNIILPVGISFYTFQTMSYTIDIYRRNLTPSKSVMDFALFVAFFPQLVAGPIERAVHLLPQIENPRQISREDIKIGCWLIVFGYFLKVFVADNLAPIVDVTFAEGSAATGAEILSSTYAFAFQIFGDFAGYSSIAIGLSRLLGIKLMTNFLYPYFVTNPQDFWKNWHISLSSWLRDYLYISLGGSRKGTLMTYRNLFLTMFLGGLWHGAAWNFVIWGVYQGSILIIHRLCLPALGKLDDIMRPLPFGLWRLVRILFMFHVTCFGWLLFRASSLDQISEFTKTLFTDFGGLSPLAIYNLKMVIVYVTPLIIIQLYKKWNDDIYALIKLRPSVITGCYVIFFFLIFLLGEFNATEFIYFRF